MDEMPTREDALWGVRDVRPYFALRVQDMTWRERFVRFMRRAWNFAFGEKN